MRRNHPPATKSTLETVELRLLSHAVLGGTEPGVVDRRMPIRPASLRGSWRAWFRAGAAPWLVSSDPLGKRGGDDPALGALRLAEARVFGATTHASPLVIGPPRGGLRVSKLRAPQQNSGLRYLGYGLFEKGSTPDHLPAGSSFTLDLRLRDAAPVEGLPLEREDLRRLLGASLWLWASFGGIGARTRRGWGAFMVEGCSLPCPAPGGWAWRAPGLGELWKGLNQGVESALAVFHQCLPRLVRHELARGRANAQLRHMDRLHRIAGPVSQHRDGMLALEEAGALMRDFRSSLTRQRVGLGGPLPDYFAVKDALRGGPEPRRHERAAFGLPLNFYFRSLGGAKASFHPSKASGDGGYGERLASPLHFCLHQHRGGYSVVLANFAGKPGELLQGADIRERRGRSAISRLNEGLVDTFETWARQESRRRGGRR